MGKLRFVIVESPYAGNVERNVKYARAALRDCLMRGEAPFASHLLYTQPGVLRDGVPKERARGVEVGLDIASRADATVVYADLGISPGMAQGIAHAEKLGRPIEHRFLGAEWEKLSLLF